MRIQLAPVVRKNSKRIALLIGLFFIILLLFFQDSSYEHNIDTLYNPKLVKKFQLTNQIIPASIKFDDSSNFAGGKQNILWPHQQDQDTSLQFRESDRIINQLRFAPLLDSSKTVIKKLYLINSDQPPGDFQCPVHNCINVYDPKEADLVMTSSSDGRDSGLKESASRIYWELESVENRQRGPFRSIDFTATYRWDSDLVLPYFKYVPFNYQEVNRKEPYPVKSSVNYAERRKNAAVWIVSNCGAHYRRRYVDILAKHFPVDIYGGCGTLKCGENCSAVIKQYKFYLAFENTQCRDYVTEKLASNAFGNKVVPIVLGAPKSDYERITPPYSFIHVDDFEWIADLGKYLKKLSNDDEAYNAYLSWHDYGTVDFNARSWCRLCLLAHEKDNILRERKANPYDANPNWWSKDQCTKDGWVPNRPREFFEN